MYQNIKLKFYFGNIGLHSVYNQRGGACVGDETAYFKDMDSALRFICWYEMLREKNFETEQKLKNPYIEVRL